MVMLAACHAISFFAGADDLVPDNLGRIVIPTPPLGVIDDHLTGV